MNPLAVMVNIVSGSSAGTEGSRKPSGSGGPVHRGGEVWWPVLAPYTPGTQPPWSVGLQLGVRLHFLGGSPEPLGPADSSAQVLQQGG